MSEFGVPVRTEIRPREWRALEKHRALAHPEVESVAPTVMVPVAVEEEPPVVAVSERWRVRRDGDGWVAIAPSTGVTTRCASQEAALDVVRAALTPKRVRGGSWPFEAEFRRLHADGMSDSRIAREIGVSQATVSSHRRRLGIPALFQGRVAK